MATAPNRQQAAQLQTARRREFVLRMKATGMTYEQVARAAEQNPDLQPHLPRGWNAAYASKDVSRELKLQRHENDEALRELRNMESFRLDLLQMAIWPMAMGQPGNPNAIPPRPPIPPDPKMVDRVLHIMRRRARLFGLDAPESVDLFFAGVSAELQTKLDDLQGADAKDLVRAYRERFHTSNGATVDRRWRS